MYIFLQSLSLLLNANTTLYFLTEDDKPFQQHVLSVVVGTYIAFTIAPIS